MFQLLLMLLPMWRRTACIVDFTWWSLVSIRLFAPLLHSFACTNNTFHVSWTFEINLIYCDGFSEWCIHHDNSVPVYYFISVLLKTYIAPQMTNHFQGALYGANDCLVCPITITLTSQGRYQPTAGMGLFSKCTLLLANANTDAAHYDCDKQSPFDQPSLCACVVQF